LVGLATVPGPECGHGCARRQETQPHERLESKGKYSHVSNPFVKEANRITAVEVAAVMVIRKSRDFPENEY
jgi:hypothetical protein